MRQQIFAAALTFSCVLSGCGNPFQSAATSASGSVGITHDDKLIFAADGDLDTVFVVDAVTRQKISEIKVGRRPEKILVDAEDTVFVTNRMGRSVSVIRAGETVESARLEVGIEPAGLSMSGDGKTLFVVNSTSRDDSSVGTLQAFDAKTLAPQYEIAVGQEPSSVAIVENSKALISLSQSGDVVTVDLNEKRVLTAGTDLFNALNATALGRPSQTSPHNNSPSPRNGRLSTSHPRGLEALAKSSDGKQVYSAALLSSDTLLANRDATMTAGVGSVGAGYSIGSNCGGTGAVAQAALLTFSAAGAPQVDDLSQCGDEKQDRPRTLLSADVSGTPLQGPNAIAVDEGGTFLFVTHMNSNNVAVIATAGSAGRQPQTKEPSRNSKNQVVSVGSGPTGVALSHDGSKAYVFNSFDHSLSLLQTESGLVKQTAVIPLGEDVLSPDAVLGRKLFFSAADPRMNDVNNALACASCHPAGRQDGHVWNFVDGPRQTPSLAGRMLAKTAPFHWNGEFKNLMDFMQLTVTKRMGGVGVSLEMERQMAAYIDSIQAPDNANFSSTPSDAVARGKQVFAKAQCQTCHSGEAFTNNEFADVGTLVKSGVAVDDAKLLPKGFNNPSLLGLARTAPYLHDGSQSTLKGRILAGKTSDKHGKTSNLSDAEVDDLVSYLKTL
jgi:YVTN family beta-propeller protein